MEPGTELELGSAAAEEAISLHASTIFMPLRGPSTVGPVFIQGVTTAQERKKGLSRSACRDAGVEDGGGLSADKSRGSQGQHALRLRGMDQRQSGSIRMGNFVARGCVFSAKDAPPDAFQEIPSTGGA